MKESMKERKKERKKEKGWRKAKNKQQEAHRLPIGLDNLFDGSTCMCSVRYAK